MGRCSKRSYTIVRRRGRVLNDSTGSQRSGLNPADLLGRRLARLAPLNGEELALLQMLQAGPRYGYPADAVLLSRGATIGAARIILSGWAARVHQLRNGRRQILHVLIPGDAIGLSPHAHPVANADIIALTSLQTVGASAAVGAWRDRQRAPGLAAAFDLVAVEEEAFLLGQIARLGRLNALERFTNWLMELDYRFTAVGLASGSSIPMPLTQYVMSDVLGLSPVHINRTLRQLRNEGWILLDHARVDILNREALLAASGFTPPGGAGSARPSYASNPTS